MPQYTYVCDNQHVIDIEHLMLDEPTITCPYCGQEMTKQLPKGVVGFTQHTAMEQMDMED